MTQYVSHNSPNSVKSYYCFARFLHARTIAKTSYNYSENALQLLLKRLANPHGKRLSGHPIRPAKSLARPLYSPLLQTCINVWATRALHTLPYDYIEAGGQSSSSSLLQHEKRKWGSKNVQKSCKIGLQTHLQKSLAKPYGETPKPLPKTLARPYCQTIKPLQWFAQLSAIYCKEAGNAVLARWFARWLFKEDEKSKLAKPRGNPKALPNLLR